LRRVVAAGAKGKGKGKKGKKTAEEEEEKRKVRRIFSSTFDFRVVPAQTDRSSGSNRGRPLD